MALSALLLIDPQLVSVGSKCHGQVPSPPCSCSAVRTYPSCFWPVAPNAIMNWPCAPWEPIASASYRVAGHRRGRNRARLCPGMEEPFAHHRIPASEFLPRRIGYQNERAGAAFQYWSGSRYRHCLRPLASLATLAAGHRATDAKQCAACDGQRVRPAYPQRDGWRPGRAHTSPAHCRECRREGRSSWLSGEPQQRMKAAQRPGLAESTTYRSRWCSVGCLGTEEPPTRTRFTATYGTARCARQSQIPALGCARCDTWLWIAVSEVISIHPWLRAQSSAARSSSVPIPCCRQFSATYQPST